MYQQIEALRNKFSAPSSEEASGFLATVDCKEQLRLLDEHVAVDRRLNKIKERLEMLSNV